MPEAQTPILTYADGSKSGQLAPQAQAPPERPITPHEMNMEIEVRLNGCRLADEMLALAERVAEPDRKARLNAHAEKLLDTIVAPPLGEPPA